MSLTTQSNKYLDRSFVEIHNLRKGTYMSREDRNVLIGLCAESQGAILEVGTHTGSTALHLAMNFPDRLVATVDYSKSYETLTEPQKKECPRKTLGCDVRNQKNVISVDAFFDSTVIESFKVPFGFVFIDADHSYDGVKRDTETVFQFQARLLSPCTVVWHDYTCPDGAGVQRPAWFKVGEYLRNLAATRDIFHVEGTTIAYTYLK